MELGKMLREAREAAGFESQQDLSYAMRFPQPKISQIEAGRRKPALETLARWAAACGMDTVPLEWIAALAGVDVIWLDDEAVGVASKGRYLLVPRFNVADMDFQLHEALA